MENVSWFLFHVRVAACVHRYYDYLLDSGLLAPGALILCDNVLFKGMVLNSLPEGKARLLEGKKLNYWQRRHQVTLLCVVLHELNRRWGRVYPVYFDVASGHCRCTS